MSRHHLIYVAVLAAGLITSRGFASRPARAAILVSTILAYVALHFLLGDWP